MPWLTVFCAYRLVNVSRWTVIHRSGYFTRNMLTAENGDHKSFHFIRDIYSRTVVVFFFNNARIRIPFAVTVFADVNTICLVIPRFACSNIVYFIAFWLATHSIRAMSILGYKTLLVSFMNFSIINKTVATIESTTDRFRNILKLSAIRSLSFAKRREQIATSCNYA